jgi:hypothetical protein
VDAPIFMTVWRSRERPGRPSRSIITWRPPFISRLDHGEQYEVAGSSMLVFELAQEMIYQTAREANEACR